MSNKRTKGKYEDGMVPPQAIDVEGSVLGAVILEEEAYHLVADMLLPDIFYKEQNALVCKAIISLKNRAEKVDLLTVSEELKSTGELANAGGYTYIAGLTQRIASAANIETHIRILLEKAIKRECIRSSTALIRNSYDDLADPFDNLEEYERNLSSLTSMLFISKTADTTVLEKEFLKQNDELTSRSDAIIGIPSGFRDIDTLTLGWQDSDMIVMAARPGMGKTALAIQTAMNAALAGVPAAIFSLEQSRKQLTKRLLSQMSEIPHDMLKKGLDKDTMKLLQVDLEAFRRAKLYIDDTGAISLFDFKQKARKLYREKGIKLIVIDYIQLMRGDSEGRGNREQEISQISRGIKATAKELNIPIIAISQLSRETEKQRKGNIPILSDLRDSGAIEQDADMVIFIYRPEYYGINTDEEKNDTRGLARIIFAKNRHGATDEIDLRWKGECMRFGNFDNTYEDKLKSLSNNEKF